MINDSAVGRHIPTRHAPRTHPMIRVTTRVGQIRTWPSTNARWAGSTPRIIHIRFREHTTARWAGSTPRVTRTVGKHIPTNHAQQIPRTHERTVAGTTPRVTHKGLSRSTRRTSTHARLYGKVMGRHIPTSHSRQTQYRHKAYTNVHTKARTGRESEHTLVLGQLCTWPRTQAHAEHNT